MWFHLSSALVVWQSLRASSVKSAEPSHRSRIAVLAVVMRGRPFCVERWTRLG